MDFKNLNFLHQAEFYHISQFISQMGHIIYIFFLFKVMYTKEFASIDFKISSCNKKQGFEEGYSQRLIEGNIFRLKLSRLRPHRLRLSSLRSHGLRLSEFEAMGGGVGYKEIIYPSISREKIM